MIVSPIASALNTIIHFIFLRISESGTNWRCHEQGQWPREQAIQLKLNLGRACPFQRTSLLKEAAPHPNSYCSLGVPYSGVYIECVPGTSEHWAHDRSPRILARFPIFLKKMLVVAHTCTILTHLISSFEYTRPSLSEIPCSPQFPILANHSPSRSLHWVPIPFPHQVCHRWPSQEFLWPVFVLSWSQDLLNTEKLDTFSLRSGPRQGCPFSPLL